MRGGDLALYSSNYLCSYVELEVFRDQQAIIILNIRKPGISKTLLSSWAKWRGWLPSQKKSAGTLRKIRTTSTRSESLRSMYAEKLYNFNR
jgi:hypothetical protein